MADSQNDEESVFPLAQQAGGFIWERHRDRIRIAPEQSWGDLAEQLLPLARDAARALADPLIPGANTHGEIVARASRLSKLLDGEIDQVASRAAAVYVASIWMGETWEADERVRRSSDALGLPLSDAMRGALAELMAVLPVLARQFPSVLKIEEEREEFLRSATDLSSTRITVELAHRTDLIDHGDSLTMMEALSAANGAGHVAEKAERTAIRSTRNLVSAAVVASAIGGFVSGEVLGGIGDAFSVNLRRATEEWVRKGREEIEEVFSSAAADQRTAIRQAVSKILSAPASVNEDVEASILHSSSKLHYIVDKSGGGDFLSISEAVEWAQDGSSILVRPGWYNETVMIDKSLSISGEDGSDEVVLSSDDGSTIFSRGMNVFISNMRIRNKKVGDSETDGDAVFVSRGTLKIENARIESDHGYGIAAMGEATSCAVLGSSVGPTGKGAIFAQGGVKFQLHNSRVFEVGKVGISAGAPTTLVLVESSLIQKCSENGIFVTDEATIKFSNSIIEDCGKVGIAIARRALAEVSGSEIIRNGSEGITLNGEVKLLVEASVISGNLSTGLFVFGNSYAAVSDSRIEKNGRHGCVASGSGSKIVIKTSVLEGNGSGAWIEHNGGEVLM